MPVYCNNCGRIGHVYNKCKIPIASHGIIALQKRPGDGEWTCLMVRRKNSLGFMDFMSGTYPLHDTQYVRNMVFQFTSNEQALLLQGDIDALRSRMWRPLDVVETVKDVEVREKYLALWSSGELAKIVTDCAQEHQWHEPEWGFPKGRRNVREKDLDCAWREFEEESGWSRDAFEWVKNVVPFEEVFIGSNVKSYKHKYYLALLKQDYIQESRTTPIHNHEISEVQWFTLRECAEKIRYYNTSKKMIIQRLESLLNSTFIFRSSSPVSA
jgi:8-oxo-dGTP pyrophosphatase MutT (NUDIX family)